MALHRFYQRSPSSVSHLVSNFRKIKLLKILAMLGSGDKQSSGHMYTVLGDIFRKGDTASNIGNAILYECICCISSIFPNPKMLDAAAETTSKFLKSDRHNLRYMAIDALGRLIKINQDIAEEHQLAVIDCLELRDLERGVDNLVAIPGRLVDMVERSRVSLEAIKYLVMDEADRMLDMGFERQIRKIVDRMNMPQKYMRQTMLFSATFPPEMQRLASNFLSNYIFITVGRVGSSTNLIMQKVEFLSYGEKRGYLLDLLQKQSIGVANSKLHQPITLVFVETKRVADSLRYWIYSKGFPAIAIHGDRTQQPLIVEMSW